MKQTWYVQLDAGGDPGNYGPFETREEAEEFLREYETPSCQGTVLTRTETKRRAPFAREFREYPLRSP